MSSSHNFEGLYTDVHIAKGCLNNQKKKGGTEGYGQSSGAGGGCSSQFLFLTFHNGVPEKVFHSQKHEFTFLENLLLGKD